MKSKKVKFGGGLEGILTGSLEDSAGGRGPVIISHGSGKGMDAPLLEKTAERLAEKGFLVLRFNFGYLGKKPAPSKDGVKERPELVAAIEYMAKYGEPILIGKSFGARVGTYVAAERDDIRALVYYGLPLHGMTKNAKVRDFSHLAKICAPMLFITGDRDRLCAKESLKQVQKKIKSKFESHFVPGDHSFKPRSEDAAIDICVEWLDRE